MSQLELCETSDQLKICYFTGLHRTLNWLAKCKKFYIKNLAQDSNNAEQEYHNIIIVVQLYSI